jgi:hypothetical protein
LLAPRRACARSVLRTYTGKPALLAATGETFENIEEQRVGKPAAA